MPIKSHIDKDQKMIHTVCTGVITKHDFDFYLNEFLSKNDITGCNEIFDTRKGDWSQINYSDLVAIALKSMGIENIDVTTKFAWVVDEDEVNAMTNFYKESKIFHDKKSRVLYSFYNYDDAMNWLRS